MKDVINSLASASLSQYPYPSSRTQLLPGGRPPIAELGSRAAACHDTRGGHASSQARGFAHHGSMRGHAGIQPLFESMHSGHDHGHGRSRSGMLPAAHGAGRGHAAAAACTLHPQPALLARSQEIAAANQRLRQAFASRSGHHFDSFPATSHSSTSSSSSRGSFYSSRSSSGGSGSACWACGVQPSTANMEAASALRSALEDGELDSQCCLLQPAQHSSWQLGGTAHVPAAAAAALGLGLPAMSSHCPGAMLQTPADGAPSLRMFAYRDGSSSSAQQWCAPPAPVACGGPLMQQQQHRLPPAGLACSSGSRPPTLPKTTKPAGGRAGCARLLVQTPDWRADPAVRRAAALQLIRCSRPVRRMLLFV